MSLPFYAILHKTDQKLVAAGDKYAVTLEGAKTFESVGQAIQYLISWTPGNVSDYTVVKLQKKTRSGYEGPKLEFDDLFDIQKIEAAGRRKFTKKKRDIINKLEFYLVRRFGFQSARSDSRYSSFANRSTMMYVDFENQCKKWGFEEECQALAAKYKALHDEERKVRASDYRLANDMLARNQEEFEADIRSLADKVIKAAEEAFSSGPHPSEVNPYQKSVLAILGEMDGAVLKPLL